MALPKPDRIGAPEVSGSTLKSALPPVELSVVIVNWNARDDLDRCLEALPSACSGLGTEILVIDNGSSDGSLDMLADEYPDVHGLASRTNLGFAGGINLGLRHSRGAWIAVLNPDVVAANGSLRALVEVLAGRPHRALAGPRILDGRGRPIVQDFSLPGVSSALRRLPGVPALRRGLRRRSGRRAALEPRRVERVNGCCMVFRREALETIGGFPESTFLYGEEIAVGGALRAAGLEVWYQPRAEVMHRDGASVDQLWTAEEKLLVFRAARLLTGLDLLSRPAFGLWTLVLLLGEVLYGALAPVARRLGRPWPRAPRRELLSLHSLALLAAVHPSFAERLRARYHRYADLRSCVR
jgi:N-acetylglucosaminyl-diphospho-decaprenol L-rhamnosyltransferase